MKVSWDVASERDPDAYESYRAGLTDWYDVAGVGNRGRTGFASRTTAFQLGDAILARARSVEQILTRDASRIRRSGLDSLTIIFDRGGFVGETDGRGVRSRPGTVLFRDTVRPSVTHWNHIDIIKLDLPRETAPTWMLGGGFHGLSLGDDTAAGRLIAGHLTTLVEVADGLNAAEGAAAIETTLALSERLLGKAVTLTPPQAAAAYRTVRRLAVDAIDRRLFDPALTVEGVARETGVSRATLYRAFDSTGGVRACIQARRLDRALGALAARRGRTPSISDIAHAHGFASDAHFSRAFRNRFGQAPGEIAGTAANDDAPSMIVTGGPRHDLILDWLRR